VSTRPHSQFQLLLTCKRRYVPHANKALRSFNMYFNVRKPPLRSKLPINPFSFLFPRPPPFETRSTSPSRTETPPHALLNTSEATPVPLAPIPPATNRRGELIFSSRVDKSFRESYTRHRAAFERRREELERIAWSKTWIGWIILKMPFSRKLSLNPSSNPTPSPGATLTLSTSSRGRGTGSAVPTPAGSRRSSPVPKRGPPTESRGETPPRWS
jgi:hypothetical protein